MKRFNIFENFIFVCIVLVIIQTLLDDISVFQQWPVEYRNYLLIAGFIFDLIFTIEFSVRSLYSTAKGTFREYFLYRRGWVDLLSSLPLLLLNSGPALYILLSGNVENMAIGIGFMNILKVIKAIRVTRVLRLIRIVKIFGRIHNTDSPMAQHHTAVITTMAVFSVILTLLGFSFLSGTQIQAREDRVQQTRHTIDVIESLNTETHISRHDLAIDHFNATPYIMHVAYNDTPAIPLNENRFHEYFTRTDYTIIEHKGYTAYISYRDLNSAQALHHIQNFVIIMVIVFGFTFLYTRHFAQNISDILYILNRGFRKRDYNLRIKINPHYPDHEIYRLARFYNDAYLPAKLKRMDKEKKKQSLSMKDLMNFHS